MGADLLTPVHLMFLGILALLLFGAKRLPEIGRGLGTGMREFKSSVSGESGLAPEPLALHATGETGEHAIPREVDVTDTT
jgi:sec-independent protein translocase protein TatA